MTEKPAGDILAIEPIESGLRIIGQIDLSNVDRFRQAIEEAAPGAGDLVLDLSGCTHLGSEGLGVLIQASRSMGDGRLVLLSPPGVILKVLDLSGLARLPNVSVVAEASG